jgi:NAD(P)H dehydrogenase (quinone)
MASVAVVYHSGFGHTAVVAEHVARGASAVPGVVARLYKADELTSPDAGAWAELAAADAIIFGAPTYMGSASAVMKQFMDASSKVWYARGWKDKIAAGFTNSASQSGDKLSTLEQFAVFAAQHGMIWTGNSILPGNNSSTGSTEDDNRLGSFLGLMTQSNADEGPDVAPPRSDRRTAELFGKRVAEVAARWASGAAQQRAA